MITKTEIMSMKYIVCFVFANALFLNSLSQSKLRVINPTPRVGDEIDIQIELEKGSKKYGHGTLKLLEVIKNPGRITIGPFLFKIENETFETNAISLSIAPKLPAESEGFWIRLVKLDSIYFLIVEQRVPSYWKKERASNGESSSSLRNKIEHFEFKEDFFEEKGFKIIEMNSSDGPRALNKLSKKDDIVSYKILTVKFKRSGSQSNKEKIDERFFEKISKNQIREEIWIE